MNFISDDELSDSDRELQDAFARGDLEPGTVVLNGQETTKPPQINNEAALLAKLEVLKKESRNLAWIERLDLTNDLAPLAPEIAIQLEDHKGRREKEIRIANSKKTKKKTIINPTGIKSIEDDPVHNDFKREMNFYRQGQEAVLKALPRLKELSVPTKRPEDYFAEMAKSDDHMKKVAQLLLKKQIATDKSEKVRKIREQKKFSKQTQVQVLQDRQKAKKEMLDSVKKYRKGQKNSLDFLDTPKGKKKAGDNKNSRGGGKNEKVDGRNKRRQVKDEKYGYGGKKKGAKWNTRESLDETFDSGKNKRGFGRGKGGMQQRSKKPMNKSGGKPKRPGKDARKRFGKK